MMSNEMNGWNETPLKAIDPDQFARLWELSNAEVRHSTRSARLGIGRTDEGFTVLFQAQGLFLVGTCSTRAEVMRFTRRIETLESLGDFVIPASAMAVRE